MNSETCPSCGSQFAVGTACPKCNDATIAPSSLDRNDDRTVAPSEGNKPRQSEPAVAELKEVGDYVLLEELARGGMGIVFKARHKELNRIVAIKMIIAGQYSSELEVQRFQLEAKAAAQLDHPGIVPIYEISSHEGQPFFAMKLVEGGSLAENCNRFLEDPRRAAKLIAEAARAVHHAHQRGILHRDIKPANILLDENDQPMLTDLGLAKLSSAESNLTQTGAVLGTPSYMPPEQAKSSHSLTTSADIYSLGAIFYELLVGKPPHRGESAIETVLQVINEPVVPVREIDSAVDRDLELICMNCLHKDPESRYETAGDLADDLERWLSGSPISIKPASIVTRATQWIKHNQGIAYVVMLLLAGMMVTMPLVLSILGVLDSAADSYTGTESDPRPLIYSFPMIPSWVSLVCGIGTLLLWPTLGMLITVITRPNNWLRAARNGGWVAGITMLLLGLLMGWALFAIASQSSANNTVRILATNVWPVDKNVETGDTEERLNDIYPKLQETPYNQKVNFLSNRVFLDGVAVGPVVVAGLFVIAFVLGFPIVCGAVIAQQLLLRRQRWWFLVPRYFLAWLSTFLTIGMIAVAVGNGSINGTKFWTFPVWRQALILILPPLATFLILRKWRK